MFYCIIFQLYYLSFGLWILYMSPDLPSATVLISLCLAFMIAFSGVIQPESVSIFIISTIFLLFIILLTVIFLSKCLVFGHLCGRFHHLHILFRFSCHFLFMALMFVVGKVSMPLSIHLPAKLVVNTSTHSSTPEVDMSRILMPQVVVNIAHILPVINI